MKKLLGKEYNPVTGITDIFWQREDGKITMQRYQDAEPMFEQNRREYNSISSKGRLSRPGLGRKVASIPMGLVEQIRMETGIDILTCSRKERLAILNDPKYSKVRTAPGRL